MVKITQAMARTVMQLLGIEVTTEEDRRVTETLTLMTLATLRAALTGDPPEQR